MSETERLAINRDIRSMTWTLVRRAAQGDAANRAKIQRRLASLVCDTQDAIADPGRHSPSVYPECPTCNESWEMFRTYLRQYVERARRFPADPTWLDTIDQHINEWDRWATEATDD